MSRFREEVARSMEDGTQPQTRPAFERMQRIHERIREGALPTCGSLAHELEVTRKTVQRDITFMRDRFQLPMEYDEIGHGWRYTGEVEDFATFEVGADELAALFLARRALEPIAGTELAEKLRGVFSKLTKPLTDRIQLDWADLDEAFSRKAPTLKPREVKLFGQLSQAIVEQREVSFSYRKLHADTSEVRHLQPLHLGEVDGGWYAIGRDLDRDALRTFALPRISRFKEKSRRFERPRDFDGREFLRRSFGIWTKPEGDPVKLVRVRMSDYAARLAQERRWHPTQEVKLLNAKGTRVEVCFEAGALEEVVRWVLSFGSRAKVIGPPELKKMVEEEIRLMS